MPQTQNTGGQTACSGDTRLPLDAVVSTDELSRRGSRPADHEAEQRAFALLMQEMTNPSGNIMQRLVETALTLCCAHSAGISLLEVADGRPRFRWHATTGRWAGFLGATMQREISPCGTVLDRNRPLLMSRPHLHYPFPPEAEPAIDEVLLVPFYVGSKPVGTVWVIAHDESCRFDLEDLRLMTSIADYASTAYIEHSMDELQAILTARLSANKGT